MLIEIYLLIHLSATIHQTSTNTAHETFHLHSHTVPQKAQPPIQSLDNWYVLEKSTAK